jgi:hypothetical protein
MGVSWLFWGSDTQTFQDKNVGVGEVRRPFHRFAAHVSAQRYLSVQGQTYRGVRGLPPYYLEIPELSSILFVTEYPKEKVTIHVHNLKTKEDIAIDGQGTGFGGGIGSGLKAGEPFSECVERVEPGRITISKRSLNWKETKVLDLRSKKIESEETFSYDANGQITNRATTTH